MVAPTPNIPPLALWHWVGWFSIVSGVLAAGVYLYEQYAVLGALRDPVFVGLILANTLTGFRFGLFFKSRLVDLIDAFNVVEHENADPIVRETALAQIFEDKLGLAFAVLFSAMIAVPVYLMVPWAAFIDGQDAVHLTNLMAAFLFFANLMVGFGLFCLLRYWQLSARRIRKVKLTILNPSRPDLILFQLMTKMIVVLSATLSCIAITSLVFSVFKLDEMTVLFSIASFTVVLAAYLVPIIPLSAIFRQTKFEELHKVETLIARHYDAQVTRQTPMPDVDLNALMTYRNEIRAIKTLPPGGEFSIVTAGSVAFVTFLPALFELILSNITRLTGS